MSVMIDLQPSAGPALVVGGGVVALRKVRNLAEGEFRVTVIAPDILDEAALLPFVSVVRRAFEDADIDAAPPWALVFACTSEREVNRRVGELARSRNIPVVVTDRQAESTFFTPATIRDGELAIAVSTGGASPGVAKLIRERIVSALGPGWGTVARLARQEREGRLAARRDRDE
ncbi:MAG: bifunctional precorrin-2 dehydrogenase/sirohydrochlorin ferrochelatase [Dehalococcoidia bacterium]|jgi:siroheme synthase-like protein